MVGVLDDPMLYRYTGGDPLPLEVLERKYAEGARGRSGDGSQLWFNWIARDRVSHEALGTLRHGRGWSQMRRRRLGHRLAPPRPRVCTRGCLRDDRL